MEPHKQWYLKQFLGSEQKDYRTRQPTTEFSFKYKLNNVKKNDYINYYFLAAESWDSGCSPCEIVLVITFITRGIVVTILPCN